MTELSDLQQDRLSVVYNHALKKKLLDGELDDDGSIETSVFELIAEYENNIDQLHPRPKDRESALARVGFLLSYLAGEDEEQLLKLNGWTGSVDRHAARAIGYCKDPQTVIERSSTGVPRNYELNEEDLRDLDDVLYNLAESKRIQESTAGQYLFLFGKRSVPDDTPAHVIDIVLQQAAAKLRARLSTVNSKTELDDKERIGLHYISIAAGHGFSTIRSLPQTHIYAEDQDGLKYSVIEMETYIAHALEALYPPKDQV